MPAFHSVPLDPFENPANPSSAPLKALTPMTWAASRNVMVAQDSTLQAGRRLLHTFGLKGRDTWPWDSTDIDAMNWPDQDDWRRVWGPIQVSLTPGHFLRLRVVYLASGYTSTPGSPVEIPASPGGAIRAGVSWANETTGASHAISYYDRLLESDDPDGALPTGAAAYWADVREGEIEIVPPTTAALAPGPLADYSEGTVATVRIEVQGGARVVDAVLYEYPAPRHVQRHDNTFPVSVHGAHVNGLAPPNPQTTGPQVARRAFGAFEERRFGTLQTLRTGARQSDRLGPHVFSWGPWASDGDNYTAENSLAADDVEPWILTGTTSLREIVSATSSYNAAQPGWVVAASHAQLHRYCDPEQVMRNGGVAVVPVRVRVRARWTGASGRGRIRLQSSTFEWIDVDFNVSGTLETREVVGWLESQPAADQPVAVLQVFGQNTAVGDSLELYAIEADFGWYN